MRDNFSLVVLPLLLEVVPLVLTVASWRLERRAETSLSKLRVVLFRGGLALSAISLLVIASCWLDPYPLVYASDGGASIEWLECAWIVAFATSVSSMILALFGRGAPRALLAASGALSVLLSYGSLLQNGV
jgi:hypothetical protein